MSESEEKQHDIEFESKLIPILREGIDMVKLIIYLKLKEHIAQKDPVKSGDYVNKLTGAIVNRLFGIVNEQEEFVNFSEKNQDAINRELTAFSSNLSELCIPLTDALRVQFLCDSREGNDNPEILKHAREIGVLVEERDVPMPARFIHLVRSLGTAFGILAPEPAPESDNS